MAPWPISSSSAYTLSVRQLASFPALSLWSVEDQSLFSSNVDSEGNFNGTCAISEENIPLLVKDDMCASW